MLKAKEMAEAGMQLHGAGRELERGRAWQHSRFMQARSMSSTQEYVDVDRKTSAVRLLD